MSEGTAIFTKTVERSASESANKFVSMLPIW